MMGRAQHRKDERLIDAERLRGAEGNSQSKTHTVSFLDMKSLEM